MNLFRFLGYAPVLRGFVALLVAGAVFPLTGVLVLRLNLITLRFMLMHGTLLGGAIALGFGLPPLFTGIAMNLLLISILAAMQGRFATNLGHITTFFMVITIGIAFAVMYRTGVPAKDTLSILWGNLYSMSKVDLGVTIGFCVITVAYVVIFLPKLRAVMFSREVAFTAGLNDRGIYTSILFLTGLTVAFAMRLIGALLLDALLLLPAILAGFFARSTRGLLVLSAIAGVFSSVCGFFLSLAIDIPASSGVTIVAALLLGVALLIRRRIS